MAWQNSMRISSSGLDRVGPVRLPEWGSRYPPKDVGEQWVLLFVDTFSVILAFKILSLLYTCPAYSFAMVLTIARYLFIF